MILAANFSISVNMNKAEGMCRRIGSPHQHLRDNSKSAIVSTRQLLRTALQQGLNAQQRQRVLL
jgi:hypothetical protein